MDMEYPQFVFVATYVIIGLVAIFISLYICGSLLKMKTTTLKIGVTIQSFVINAIALIGILFIFIIFFGVVAAFFSK